jgi:hypothetical protein
MQLEEALGCTWMGGYQGGIRVELGCQRRCLTPTHSPAVLTEAGQPCRFPFRYGGRMVHSCTSEGSAHRKW